jgi:hydrogenase maturation protease
MDIARLTDTLPERRALIGVEPAVVDWGDTLTPAVEAALPQVLEQVRALLARWNDEDGPAR